MPEMAGLDEGGPLFAQVAERLAGEIAAGGLAEGERVPSTNELAAYYRIIRRPRPRASTCSPMRAAGETAGHWHVRGQARGELLARRRAGIHRTVRAPLLTEATWLGFNGEELIAVIRSEESSEDRGGVAVTPAISAAGADGADMTTMSHSTP